MSKRLRIAYFSALFPPTLDAEAMVSGKLAAWLKDRGHDVRVYAAELEMQRLHVIPGHAARRILKDLAAVVCFNYPILRYQSVDLGRTWEASSYVKQALAASLADHRALPFDCIVSRYMPIESSIAAYWVFRRWRIPWVSALNDPLPVLPKYRVSLSQSLLRGARRVGTALWHRRLIETPCWRVFPCDRLREWTAETAKSAGIPTGPWQTRCSSIPHMGIGLQGVSSGSSPSPADNRKRLLRHLGRLYPNREVITLVRALEMWDKSRQPPIRIEFVGEVAPIYKECLLTFSKTCSPRVEIGMREVVPRPEALELTRTATACLVIEAPDIDSIYLPSKFVDCAAMRRPILAITTARSPIGDYLRQYGGGSAVTHGDVEGTYRALAQVLSMSEDDCATLADQFSAERVGGAWEDLLFRLTEEVTQHPAS